MIYKRSVWYVELECRVVQFGNRLGSTFPKALCGSGLSEVSQDREHGTLIEISVIEVHSELNDSELLLTLCCCKRARGGDVADRDAGGLPPALAASNPLPPSDKPSPDKYLFTLANR